MPSAKVIASAIIIKPLYTDINPLIPGFSVHSGLPRFSAELSVSTERKDEFIYLL